MKRDSSLPISCSAMKTSSLAKNDVRGSDNASAMSRTSIGCFLVGVQGSPSAAVAPLLTTNIAVSTRTETTEFRLRFMLRHYFDARNPGRETGNQELLPRRNRRIIPIPSPVNYVQNAKKCPADCRSGAVSDHPMARSPDHPMTLKALPFAKSSRKRYNFLSPAFSRQPEGIPVVSSDRRPDSAKAISSS